MPRKITTKARGIYEVKPGIWAVRYADAEGRLRRERAGSRSAALDLYHKRKAEVKAGIKLPHNLRFKGETVADLGQKAIDFYQEHERKDVRTFSGRMKAIMESSLGSCVADDLRASDVDKWLSEMRKAKDWTPATTNRYKTVLSKALQLGVVSGKLKANVARLVASRRENNGRIRYLKPEEETEFRETVQQRCPDNLYQFEVALNTGMRKGEQFTLEWPQINWDSNLIQLDKTKNGSRRNIPMNRICRDVLLGLWKNREENIARGEKVNNKVFQSSRRNAAIRDPKKWFENVIKEAGIEDFVWHDLRHTFCSRLVMKGVPLRTVAELAGHKTITTTMRYSHLSQEHNQAAIELLVD